MSIVKKYGKNLTGFCRCNSGNISGLVLTIILIKFDKSFGKLQILRKLTEMIEKDRKRYCFIGTESNRKKVFYDDIIWLTKEKNAKYVTYILENERYTERESLESAVEKLDNGAFVMVERGCAVNLKHVMRLTDCALQLSNQDTVAISRARMAGVKEKLHRFWGEEEW